MYSNAAARKTISKKELIKNFSFVRGKLVYMTKIVPAQLKEKWMTAVAIDFNVFNLPGWPKNPNSSKPHQTQIG